MIIEKFISPFIEEQFPSFYAKDGPTFILFVKAYYEWLEQPGNVLNQSRSIPEYTNIDSTPEEFVTYFKNQFMNSFPENMAADKKFMIKHIQDLYNSKGTVNSYKLLFRMLFNEDIDIYTPGDNLFKLSDGTWIVKQYIEISDSPYLPLLIGNKIYSSSTLATAIVDDYYTTSVSGKLVNILVIENVYGDFKFGETILSKSVPQITTSNAPIIYGSLSALGITEGGLNYKVGDILSIQGSGAGGLAKVMATTSKNGEVNFTLIQGGNGFSLNAVVNVDGAAFPIINVTNTNPVVITTGEVNNIVSNKSVRIDLVQGSSLINTPTYSYFANVINSTSFSLYSDINLTTSIDGTGYGTYVSNTGFVYLNTGGVGASFNVGSLVNKEILKLNTDFMANYYNTVLDDTVAGYTISIANTVGTFTSGDVVYMSNVNTREVDCTILTGTTLLAGETLSNTALGISNIYTVKSDGSYLLVKGSDILNANLTYNITLTSSVSNTYVLINNLFPVVSESANAIVTFSNSSVVTCNSQSGYFILGETLHDATSNSTAIMAHVTRNTDWGFPLVIVPNIHNMDTPINETLTFVDKEVGTIASISGLRPGSLYSTNPIVTIIEPLVYNLRIKNSDGSYKGFNAVVTANASSGTGIVTAVKIVDSGYGVERDQMVNLASSNNNYIVQGTTVVNRQGVAQGYWKDNKGFLSDTLYLQDSYYYQKYSYEVIASRMKDTYENYISTLIEPVGLLMFGSFINKNELVSNTSFIADEAFIQA